MSRRLIDLARPVGTSPGPALESAAPALPELAGSDLGPNDQPQVALQRDLHRELVASLDVASLAQAHSKPDQLRAPLRTKLLGLIDQRQVPLTKEERAVTVEAVLDEALGLGPLERLLRTPGITDILVNGPSSVYVESGGKLSLTDVRFRDEEHLRHIIGRIVGAMGRRIDETNPMVDARLADGSRVNAVIPPVALRGSAMSIRRFSAKPLLAEDLTRLGALPPVLMELLLGCVRAKMNILVSGGTGSGKTTLLNVLSSAIPDHERVVTIEDAAELRLQQRHVVALETRPPNLEGHGEVTARSLVRNALRMRPDRIIIGEIRSEEALDMLQAMNTGHEGSLGTIHANGPRHALGRLQTMVGLSLNNMPTTAIREMIAGALHLVVQVQRGVDGKRRVTGAEEVLGIEDGVIQTRTVFEFRQTTVNAAGRALGVFVATREEPSFFDRFRANGQPIPETVLGLEVET